MIILIIIIIIIISLTVSNLRLVELIINAYKYMLFDIVIFKSGQSMVNCANMFYGETIFIN
jgi:hypothetical protein